LLRDRSRDRSTRVHPVRSRPLRNGDGVRRPWVRRAAPRAT